MPPAEGVPQSLAAGFSELRTQSVTKGVFKGNLRRSAAKIAFMNACRAEKRARARAAEGLARAWDMRVLRVGDACVGGDHDQYAQPNQYTFPGILRHAFRSHRSSTEGGLEASSHGLALTSSVAEAAVRAQEGCVARLFEDAFRAGGSGSNFVICRSYDMTPIMTFMGSMQDKLVPSGRYLLPDGDIVKHTEYMRKMNRRPPHKCVAELLAQSCSFALSDSAGFRTESMLLQPVFCESSSGSVLFRAVDQASEALSGDSLNRYGARASFGIVSETADAAKSNRRKQQETSRRLPSHVLFHASACSGHRLHLTVTTSIHEKAIIGDVHASVFVMGLPGSREKMLHALRLVLDRSFERLVGLPIPEAHTQHASLLWDHCVLRHSLFVRGRLHEAGAGPRSQAQQACAARLLSMLNGDIRSETPHHICVQTSSGGWCCESRADALEKTFAAIVSSGLLVDSSITVPSINRWGTCTQAMSHIAAGMHFHNLLGQCARAAFPQAESFESDAPQPDEDDMQARRRYVQSKTARFVKLVTSEQQRMETLLVAWAAEPLDHANQRLQHLNAKGGMAMDIVHVDTSPIQEAQRAFCRMVQEPWSSGPLSCVRWHHGAHSGLIDRARSLIVGMNAQLWYRFLDYFTWPLKFLNMADPRHDQAALATELFEMPPCCLDAGMSLKAKGLFLDAMHMSSNAEFMTMIRAWSNILPLDSMHIEKQFAQIKAAAGKDIQGKVPFAERVMADGLLTQWRRVHAEVAGSRPWELSRKRLLAMGVPLRCKKKTVRRKLGGGGGFLQYRQDMLKQKRSRLPRALARRRDKDIGRMWRELPPDERSRYRSLARLSKEEPARAEPSPETERQLTECLFGLCDADFPVAPTVLEQEARRACGVPLENAAPGFSRFAPAMRQRFLDAGYVANGQDIPDSRRYEMDAPCPLVHPGVCRTRDADVYDRLMSVADLILKVACREDWSVGSYVLLEGVTEDGKVFSKVVYLAYMRRAHPRLLVFVRCEEHLFPCVKLATDQAIGTLRFGMVADILRDLFVAARGSVQEALVDPPLDSLKITRLSHCNDRGTLSLAWIEGMSSVLFECKVAEASERYRRRGTRRVGRATEATGLSPLPEALVAAFATVRRGRGHAAHRPPTGARPAAGDVVGDDVLSGKPSSGDSSDFTSSSSSDGEEEDLKDGLERAIAEHYAAAAAAQDDSANAKPRPGGAREKKGDRYERVACGGGEIVVNMSNKSLDAHCLICSASKDRKWTERARARAPSSKAQGRPLGAFFAWLHVDCNGDPLLHSAQYAGSSHEVRAGWRRHYRGDPLFQTLFDKERPPRDEEIDGEPLVPP